MEVKNCNRSGCENIGCSRYSNKFGYLCEECFTELTYSNCYKIVDFMNSAKWSKMSQEFRKEALEKIFSNA